MNMRRNKEILWCDIRIKAYGKGGRIKMRGHSLTMIGMLIKALALELVKDRKPGVAPATLANEVRDVLVQEIIKRLQEA